MAYLSDARDIRREADSQKSAPQYIDYTKALCGVHVRMNLSDTKDRRRAADSPRRNSQKSVPSTITR